MPVETRNIFEDDGQSLEINIGADNYVEKAWAVSPHTCLH